MLLESDPPLMESIPSGGVMGLQNWLTLDTGAEYPPLTPGWSPALEPGVMAGLG